MDLVRDLGEEGLIRRLRDRLQALAPPVPSVLLGIGDDAAVLQSPSGSLLATTDLFIQDVHFRLEDVTGEELGHKALAVGLSDIAAMGGKPLYALVSLALPGKTPLSFVDGLYEGLGALAGSCGVTVVGGDTTGSLGPIVVDVLVLGETMAGGPFLAAGARPGDVLMVTGELGASAAGLRILLEGGAGLSPGSVAEARRAHLCPRARLGEAAALAALAAEEGGWRPAARDASDGLAAAARALATVAGVAIEINLGAVPVAASARELAAARGIDPAALALTGGEDYELVFTVPERAATTVTERVRHTTGTPVTIIGRVREGKGVSLALPDGSLRPLGPGGFRHF